MQQATLSPIPSPSVSLVKGRPATTSLEVAKFFGKRHDDVLKSIRNLCANCPERFTARNFAASEYTDETGRSLVMFILYRDGFMLLVMGYTGKKAMQIKIAYIEAFNQMEAQVLGKLAGEKALPALTIDQLNNRLNELRIRTRNEISSICADLMEYAEQRAGISRLLCHEIRPVVFDMLVTVVSEGTDVRFKYANPCYFIRSVANALPNARFVTSPHLSTIR